jgi:O-antigen/teichoic acid export membrane protein
MFSKLTWKHPNTISRTHNVLWNGASRLIQVGLQFLFVPIHIHLLGPSSYGLVVLSASLMALVAFVDHVTSTIVTREFGLHNGDPKHAPGLWKLMSRMEPILAMAAVGIGMLTPFLAFVLTRNWTQIEGLPSGSFWLALLVMGGMIGCQCLGALYAAALMGLQRQKLLSFLRVVWTPLYYGVGAALLYLINSSVIVLFAWQACALLGLAIILRVVLHRTMPALAGADPQKAALAPNIWKIGAASMLMTLTGAAISQLDKFVVAMMVKPAEFAAYGLTFSIAMQAMTLASSSFAGAMFPHFAQMLTADREAELRQSYHRWTQMIVLSALLIGGVLFWFGPSLVDLWLGTASPLASDVKRLLPLFLPSWALNAAITAPVILIMALGRLHLVYAVNFGLILLAGALLPWVLGRWGVQGGAAYWLAVNLGYCLVMVPMLHKSVLKGSLARWLIRDVGLPVLMAGGMLFAATAILPGASSLAHSIIQNAIVMLVYLGVLLALLPDARAQLSQSLRFLRG